MPLAVPARTNERWSMDFVSDQLANGQRIRVLNVVDDYSREAILQLPEFSISGLRVTRELEQLLETRGAPRTLVCDKGPEFTSKAMSFWARKRRIRIHFTQPGKPTWNAFVESFNGKFRDFCLNLHWFAA